MKIKALLLVLVVLTLFASFPVLADTSAHEGECHTAVSLYNGWARATVEGAPNGAAFGLLVNLTDEADTLVSAATDAAEVVELHEMVMEGDVMQMRPLEGGFPVPAAGFTELKPGGYHIMLIGLTRVLEAGSMLDLTLTFEHAGEVMVTIPVRDMDAMEGMGGGMDMGDMAATEEPMHMEGEEDPCAGVMVLDPWARPAGAAQPNGGAFALLVNPSSMDDHLVSAVSDVAQVVELHEMVMNGDVMQMRPLEGGFHIPAVGATQLMPGGYHIMLIGLTRELVVGETFEVTLTFEHSGEQTVTFTVREPMEEGGAMGGM
ncbi:MAG: copper chaperone PCu(A)C [Anaerolinea sp.]|nr:copper chaperone PCu(A)C [Anaerolinea sp.]